MSSVTVSNKKSVSVTLKTFDETVADLQAFVAKSEGNEFALKVVDLLDQYVDNVLGCYKLGDHFRYVSGGVVYTEKYRISFGRRHDSSMVKEGSVSA